ncbi:MAG: acyl-CoA dehydrogenase family protein [Deltaproteobacteria bacterium]|nr:acyl-CoA dehydrogenase family protein [Deltaproteobacteria bacterium]
MSLDFYLMDDLFSDEDKLIRKTVRAFVKQSVLPNIADWYESATFPKHLISKMAELGLLGANLAGYGCVGLGPTAYGLMMQELEAGDSGLRSFVSVQGALVMYPIYTFGSEAQKEKWLPQLQQGKAIGCFGLTEPSSGSNPGGMKTTAKKVSDGYVLNGSKYWITNATVSDICVIWAKTEEGIRGFLVETDRAGVKTQDIPRKLALRASVTGEVVLSDCKIPKENLLPKSEGLKSALMCLNQARYGISWGAIGAAVACYEEALEYTKNRMQFDKPIAGFQLVQEKLAWMVSEITKAQLVALRLAQLKEAKKIEPYHISLAKRNNVWMALEVARLARDMLGANGTAYDYHVGRHMCNLEAVKTYEGTHDIHTLVIGEAVTGIPAYR